MNNSTQNHKPHRYNVHSVYNKSNHVSSDLPVVINLNPRSLYGKENELATIIEQYNCDICCVSESWERENYTLNDLIQIEHFKIVTNVKQRYGRGGKPAIIANESKYQIKELCPSEVTVPVNVEAVWILIHSKNIDPKSPIKNIIICSYYLCWTSQCL